MLRHSRGPRRPASYSARSPSIRPLVGNAQARRFSPQDGGLWACGGLPERWELVAVLRPITALGARTCHFPPPFNSSHQVSFTSASSRADRACLERAGRTRPANGRLRGAVGADVARGVKLARYVRMAGMIVNDPTRASGTREH